MEEKNKDKMSRRDFIKETSLVAAGTFAGVLAGDVLGKDMKEAAKKIRSFNPDMRYRRLGKTDMMVSSVCLGGHWKRIPFRSNTDEFHKNRYDVVSKCIEVGINHIDANVGSQINP